VSPTASGSFVILAKEPAAGRVKTRLTPPLSPEQAAELYACMLDDVLDATAGAAERVGWGVVLAVDPPEAGPALARRAPARRMPPRRAGSRWSTPRASTTG